MPPVTVLASPGNKCAAIHGASHASCRSGKHCAGLGRPSLAGFVQVHRIVQDAHHPWFAVVSFSYRSSWGVFYAQQQKGKKPPYCHWAYHPQPPQGGFRAAIKP